MNNNKIIHDLIKPRLKSDEELVGYFHAMKSPSAIEQIKFGFLYGFICALGLFITHSFWWVLAGAALGGLVSALLGRSFPKSYCLAVTNKGIYRVSQSSSIPYLGKTASYFYYPFDEIAHLKMREGYLSTTLALQLNNGKNVSFLVSKYPGMTEKTKAYLLAK